METKDNKTVVTVRNGGSLRIEGDFELKDQDGNVLEHKGAVSICRCGLSENMPFCDGGHKTNGFIK